MKPEAKKRQSEDEADNEEESEAKKADKPKEAKNSKEPKDKEEKESTASEKDEEDDEDAEGKLVPNLEYFSYQIINQMEKMGMKSQRKIRRKGCPYWISRWKLLGKESVKTFSGLKKTPKNKTR